MKSGIPGFPVPLQYPYAAAVNTAAEERDFSPLFAYAIFYRETIHGEVCGWWNACTVVASDGGRGLGQITPPWNPVPVNWIDPLVNARASIAIMNTALEDWAPHFSGVDLIRLTAATYNAGYGNALRGHNLGDVDTYTTHRYAAGVIAYFNALLRGRSLESVAT